MKEVRKDILKNAYFGKPYRTRDGRKAIYWRKLDFGHRLICEELHCSIIAHDDGKIQTGQDNKVDIVSEWKEEISEEELDSIAWCKAIEEYIDDYRGPYAEGFKAGYRKSIEQYESK